MNKCRKLDEMQIQKRNKIGNNCFMAMYGILFIGIGLYEIGIKWINSPLILLVIINVCMGYYQIKTIRAGLYLGVSSQNKTSKYVLRGIIASIFILISGIIITVFLKGKSPITSNSGSIFIVIVLFLSIIIVSIILGNISKHKSESGEE